MPPKQPPAAMHRQEDRLASFAAVAKPKARARHGWPHTIETHPLLTPENMAHAGFYFSPGGSEASFDTCACFLCGVRLGGWAEEDDPWQEHATRGDCAWAETVCRVELDKRADRTPVYTEADMLPSSSTSSWIRENTYYSKERKTCWWPYVDEDDFIPQPATLAAAGFVYTPTTDSADLVTCPHCTYAVEGWEAEDDPMEIHRRKRPECAFFMAEVTSATTSKGKRAAKSKKKVTDEDEPVPARTGGHSRTNSRSQPTTTAATGPRTRQQTSEAPSEAPPPVPRATRAKRAGNGKKDQKSDLVEVDEDQDQDQDEGDEVIVIDTTEAEETEAKSKSKSKSKSTSRGTTTKSRSTKGTSSKKGKGKKTDDEQEHGAPMGVEEQQQQQQEEEEEEQRPKNVKPATTSTSAKKGSKTSSRKTLKASEPEPEPTVATMQPEPETAVVEEKEEVKAQPAPAPAPAPEPEVKAAPKAKPARKPRATKAKKKEELVDADPQPAAVAEPAVQVPPQTQTSRKPLPPLPPPSPAPAPAPLSQLERFGNIPPSSPVSLPLPTARPSKAIPTAKKGKANSQPAPRPAPLARAAQAAPLETGALAARQVVDTALDSFTLAASAQSSQPLGTDLKSGSELDMNMEVTLEQWIRAEMVRKRADIEREGREMIRAFEHRTADARRRIESIPTR